MPFAEGLTADNVKEGPPLWAGQARHQRIDDARVRAAAESADGADGAGGADGTGVGEKREKEEALPAPPKAGRAPMAVPKPSSPQRFQVTINIAPKPSSLSLLVSRYSR